ncbi:hypothetical protein PoB_004221100 [Plakobranchus ocellatus]|uniref:Uncharacterized protein n=1 Tax=Plakobranchus ocellatus TaxID=259542 RepID=A0AAV4BA65_9GAST|nr:hypothetical protein PoB_004221100 [Plakobranchus ocellatus]
MWACYAFSLEQTCTFSSDVLQVRQNRRCHRRPNFGPQNDFKRRQKMGRLLVFHISDILVNLNYKDTLREMVDKKLDILLDMGFTVDNIQSLYTGVIQFLQQNYSKYWTRYTEQACSTVFRCLNTLGNDYLASRGMLSREEHFKDVELEANLTGKPRASAQTHI